MNAFYQDTEPTAINRVDASRYPIGHTIYTWLCSNGYRVKIENDRLWLVRAL